MLKNPYESPKELPDASGPSRWPYLGWLTPVVTWLPALLLLALAVPDFFEIFGELHQRGELPALSSCVLALARISRSLFHLPIVIYLSVLIVADVALAQSARRRRVSWPHSLWQAVICTIGMAAAAVIVVSLMLPMIRTSATI